MPGIARGGTKCLEILVFLSADVVVEAGHARGSERANLERVCANCDGAGEAIAGTVASYSACFEEGKGGLNFGKRRSAVEVGKEHSVPRRDSGTEVAAAGGAEAVEDLWVEEHEVATRATDRSEMAESFMWVSKCNEEW